MRELSKVPGLYVRIVRTYFGWARSLLPLAALVFLPLGLIHAIPVHYDATEFDFHGAFELVVLVTAILALGATGLIGEVFYAGAVAIALTHPHEGRPPSLREVARMVSYRRLIAIDLIYGVLVVVGLVALVVPGVLVYAYLGLAAPVIEIERRTVRDALSRSIRLVRGHFWLVAAILLPLEIVGDGATNLVIEVAQDLLGQSFLAEWLADAAGNVLVTPFYAVAVVLLAVDLIAVHDGSAPRLHSGPSRA